MTTTIDTQEAGASGATGATSATGAAGATGATRAPRSTDPDAFPTRAQLASPLSVALAEQAVHNDLTGEFPAASLQVAHDAGVFDLFLAQSGAGADGAGEAAHPLSLVENAALLQELGHGDPSVALILSNTVGAHRGQQGARPWPTQVWAEVVAATRERPVIINTARAEPELGAPARGGLPASTARRTRTGWSVSGHKSYVTGSTRLDYHLVWVKTDEPTPRVGHVIVPRLRADGRLTDGIEVVPTWDHLGLRASSTHDVIYTDIEVPEDHFLEIPFRGTYVDPAGQGGAGSLGGAAIYVGVARAAQEFFVSFANDRVPTSLGRPIATTERIQTVAGEIEAQLVQAEELLYGLTARAARGDADAIARTQIAKPLIIRSAISAVQTAIAALGNPALTRHNPLERHLRDVLCGRVHPPQEDTALVATGRRSLGLV